MKSRVLEEIGSLLYWTMLAACTVGPGTVVTCARAGAEFGLNLTWALLFASILAYTLQEGTARLTIVSGKSLGQCLRVKYKSGAKIYNTAVICWFVAIAVFLGNTLYECNNWAGGIDAVLALPGANDLEGGAMVGLRVGACLAYAVVVLSLLYWDKTDKLGVLLGLVMMSMVTLFLIVVIQMGLQGKVDGTAFAWGLLPNLPPRGDGVDPADIIISLVGTTSIGFNLFLGGAMAEGKEIKGAQRGIAFSTGSALAVSVLILIVGAGANSQITGGGFKILQLVPVIKEQLGEVGVVIFALGFIAAALSSMLTVPLGAALTAESVFSEMPEKTMEPVGRDNPNFSDEQGVANQQSKKAAVVEMEMAVDKEGKQLPRWIYLGIMFVMVTISTVVIAANADRSLVILIAQVFNGCLLPFFSICLLLCLNDPQFMGSSPQKGWANIFLVVSVTITLFLASNVILSKIFSLIAGTTVALRLVVALCLALAIITILFLATSLGRQVLNSVRRCY